MSLLSYLGLQRARLNHGLRWAVNHLRHPDVILVGEYHGANLGDHLLGQAVASELRSMGHSPALLTLHNLAREKHFKGVPILMGGGNSLHPHALDRLQKYWQSAGKPKIAGVGLDFVWPEVFQSHNSLFRSFAQIVFRSEVNAELVRTSLGVSLADRVSGAPDMVWLLRDKIRNAGLRDSKTAGRVGINILPLFLHFGSDGLPVCAIDEGDPFRAQATKESEAYRELVLAVVGAYQSRGYEIVHIPFDVGDDKLARQWLQPIGVRCAPYTTNLKAVMRQMASCEFFIPTRFHALLCAMSAGIPAKPIPYALKNADLLSQFGFEDWARQTPEHFCEDDSRLKEMLLGLQAVIIDGEAAEKAQLEARAAVRRVADALFTA